MGFKKRKISIFNYDTPQKMYEDYKNRKIQGLIDYQSDVINNYMQTGYNEPNIALELPTGSGKTLIGLVIGEFRRRKNKEKIVYLCPTKQLVNQVVEQAENKYGIKTYAFTGKQAEYDPIKSSEYKRAECIAITTYSGLFNSNSFFKDVDIIIFDDAHSSEDYIASNWSVDINRYDSENLFKILVEYLKEIIGISNYNKMMDDELPPDQVEWCEMIPNIRIMDKIDEIVQIINGNLDDNIKYSWANIKEHLYACNIYISRDTILIRPYIPPTLTNEGFKNATQRIYMSATLGVSGELERITGIEKIKRLPMVSGWDKKMLGRRFFIFPNASFKQDDIDKLEIEMLKMVDRALVLVKDNKSAKKLKKYYEDDLKLDVFTNADIEKTTKAFTNSNKSIAVLANRYDGIDLLGDQCRLLIIYNIPKTANLQERFITTRMAAAVLFKERLKTKLVQALGRCTRDAVDYSAVCVMEEDVANQLFSYCKQNAFYPELQAEINFGYDQYDEYNEVKDVLENLDTFFAHSTEWQENADDEIIQMRDEILKNNIAQSEEESLKLLRDAVRFEVKYQYAVWREDYENALQYVEKIVGCLNNNELKGYRGFWNYIAGCISYKLFKLGDALYEEKSVKYLRNASACSDSITWFNKLVKIKKNENNSMNDNEDNYISYCIERIEEEIYTYGIKNNTRFEKAITNILSLLNDSGVNFEQGQQKLGTLLGYISENSKDNAAPDPWWIVNENLCIVSEDKMYDTVDKAITVKDVREALSHETWIRNNIKTINKDAKIITIFVTNSQSIEKSAVTFAGDLYYVNKEDFINWARHALDAIRRIRMNFIDTGNLLWRTESINKIKETETSPRDYIDFITSKKLKDIECKCAVVECKEIVEKTSV